MKKSEQLAINELVLNAINAYNTYVDDRPMLDWTRLRSCSAEVANVGRYYVLRSYSTIVAIIDRETDTCYDFLRLVYGYTATSAQHISKFRHDYGRKCDPITGECQWGCAHEFMWKAV